MASVPSGARTTASPPSPSDTGGASHRYLSTTSRLEAVQKLRRLFTLPDEAFHRISRLARRLTGAPISLVTIVTADRQLVLGADGLDESWDEDREVPIQRSVCQHVVARRGPLAIENLAEHPLTESNPLCLEKNLRAYLGVPFIMGDEVLGALCVLDTEPRAWSEDEVSDLADLAAVLGRDADVRNRAVEVDLRRDAAARRQALMAAAIDIVDDLFFVLTDDLRLYEWNQSVNEITGYTDEELAGLPVATLIAEESHRTLLDALPRALDEGESCDEAIVRTKPGAHIPFEVSARPFFSDDGELIGFCGTGRNITQRKRAEAALTIQRATLEEHAHAVWEAQRRFDAVVSNVPGVVYQCIAHPDGTLSFPFVRVGLWRDPLYQEADLNEADADRLFDLLHPEDEASFRRSLHPDEADLDTEQVAWEGRLRIGEDLRWVSAISHPTPLDNGSIRWEGLFVDVTAQKEAEAALRRSEAHHRSLIEASPDIFFRLDRDGRHLDVAAADATKLAASIDAIVGHTIEELMPPDVAAQWMEAIADVLDSVERSEIDYELRTLDGEQHHFEARIVPVGPNEVQAIVRDVTERYASQRALRQSEIRFRSFIEATAQVIWQANPDSDIRELSHTWRSFTGEKPGANGYDWLAPIHPDDLPRVRSEWASLQQEPKPYVTEYRIRRHDGVYHRFRARAVPIYDGDTFLGWTGTLTDVESQRQAEEALQQSEERLRLALDAARMGMWDVDLLTGKSEWSPRLRTLYGITDAHPRRESTFYALLHPDDAERVRETTEVALERAEAGETQRVQHEYRVMQPDGTERWFRSMGSVYLDALGRPVRMLGIALDITEEKKHEQNLIEAKEVAEEALRRAEDARCEAEQARQEAEEAARIKSALLANMSHEIRTPLTGIIGFAEVIAEEAATHGDNDELNHAEFARRIGSSGRRLLDTLNSVLDLAQIEAGGGDVQLHPLDVRAVAGEAVELLRPRAEEKGLDLQASFPNEPLVLPSDAAALHRVVTNLVTNAIKFTRSGHISVSLWREGDEVVLVVADTGVGIGRAFLSQLFAAFRQESEGDARSYEGSGLGLAITRHLVEMLGGTISVASEKGGGSTFTVRFTPAP